jgi:thiol:disulfide interchange protein DsbA
MFLRKAAALFAALLVSAFAAFAQQPGQPYELLNPPQPTEGGDKIEVIEFFWYGCPHCYALEPSLVEWTHKMPKDVVFKRVHPNTGGWESHASIYYTLEAMGLLEQYHRKVFEAIHKDNVNLGNKRLREEWLAKNGIDPAKYAEVEKSFSVVTKMQRARQMASDYKIDSVPKLVVDGKYVVTGENVIRDGTLDKVIDLARRSKASKPAAAPAAPAKK